jgi:AhpD family alkylhydroperoxidase
MAFRIEDQASLQGIIRQAKSLHHYVQESGLEFTLVELTNMRASQINGCAVCLAMHAKLLRDAGEREDRLHVLAAWRDTDWFTDRERAALEWTEAVTKLERNEVPQEIFDRARAQFSERELADLTLSIGAINMANRLNIAFTNSPEPFSMGTSDAVAAD